MNWAKSVVHIWLKCFNSLVRFQTFRHTFYQFKFPLIKIFFITVQFKMSEVLKPHLVVLNSVVISKIFLTVHTVTDMKNFRYGIKKTIIKVQINFKQLWRVTAITFQVQFANTCTRFTITPDVDNLSLSNILYLKGGLKSLLLSSISWRKQQ